MIKKRLNPRLYDFLVLGGTVVFMLIAWQAFTGHNPARTFLFASPLLIAQAALQDLSSLPLWQDTGITLAEILAGLILGTLGGTAAGLLFSFTPMAQRRMAPLLAFLGSIQVFTIAPLMIVWFGIGFGSKVAMATFATFFVALQQAADGARALDAEVGAYARSLGTKPFPYLRYVLWPGALSFVLSGLRLNIGFATMGALIGEFISSEYGLGHYIFNASGLYDVPRVLLGVLLLSTLNLLLRRGAGAVCWAAADGYAVEHGEAPLCGLLR